MRSDARKGLEGLCPCDSPNCSDAARKQQATVADVLAAHEPFGGGEFCSCTEPDEDGARLPLPVFWEEHLAAQIQPLLDQAADQARADLAALRGRVEALADEWEAAVTWDGRIEPVARAYGQALRLRALLADAPDNATAGNGGEPA